MRGTVSDLPTAHPLTRHLPALLQEDEFVQRFAGAFDEVLSPILTTLDNLWVYLDPFLASEDFLEWLAGWVAVVFDDTWPLAQRRHLVAQVVELYERRGTVRGLREHLELYGRVDAEIIESGGTRWSNTPDGEAPGVPGSAFIVRVTSTEHDPMLFRRLQAIVQSSKPAHVVHQLEIVGNEDPS